MSGTDSFSLRPVDRVLTARQALGLPTRATRSGWRGPCPSGDHDDRRDSWTLAEGEDGRALIHCFAGCTTASQLDGLGLPMSALFVRGSRGAGVDLAAREREGIAIEREHALIGDRATLAELHRDQGWPAATLAAYAVRATPDGRLSMPWRDGRGRIVGFGLYCTKTRRPDFAGPPKMTEPGGALGLLLPAAGTSPGRLVVTEGGAAALSAWTCGMQAHAMPSAGFDPPTGWARLVKGSEVVLLPDADTQGREAADRWRAWATRTAESVAVVDLLPDCSRGEDLADVLAERGPEATTDVLVTAIDRATFDRPNRTRGRPASAITAARDYLRGALSDGAWHSVTEISKGAPQHVSARTIESARRELGIESKGFGKRWMIRLTRDT